MSHLFSVYSTEGKSMLSGLGVGSTCSKTLDKLLPFINSVHRYILNTCYVQGTILNAQSTAAVKTNSVSGLMAFIYYASIFLPVKQRF